MDTGENKITGRDSQVVAGAGSTKCGYYQVVAGGESVRCSGYQGITEGESAKCGDSQVVTVDESAKCSGYQDVANACMRNVLKYTDQEVQAGKWRFPMEKIDRLVR